MATHLVRILSQSGGIRVLSLTRALLAVADTMPVADTQCLCVEDTPARCAGGRAAVREYSGATPSPPSTHSHTPDIATLRCRGTSVTCLVATLQRLLFPENLDFGIF